MRIATVLPAFLSACLLGGCQAASPTKPLQLAPESLQQRFNQSRRYVGIAESDLLSACAGVLQDLGFTLTQTHGRLGLIVAAKDRDAGNKSQSTLATLLNVLADIDIAVDKEQQIRASLVTRPVADSKDAFVVRITFQRVVRNSHNEISRRESLDDAAMYQRFFDRLSKSIFLEAHAI